MKSHFDVQATRIDGVIVLRCTGELDALTAPRLAEAIARGLAEAAVALLVDLSGLQFLASTGMAVLLRGQQSADASSQRFGVVADGSNTSRPMKLMGLDSAFSIYLTLEAALADIP